MPEPIDQLLVSAADLLKQFVSRAGHLVPAELGSEAADLIEQLQSAAQH